jgi:6-phosphofructokinase 1
MKIGILTGGGDCPGLNPAIRGFVMKALDYGFEVWGIREGWKGLVKGIVEEKPLTVERVEEIISQGGTMLLSSRTNPFKEAAQLAAVKENIQKYGFEVIVALGGEDTLGVASKLWKQEGIPTIGIPKTMDNDLSETDYTFGFDTSVSVAVDAVDRLRDTAKSHSRVMVLEVMGRHAGWVALYTGIAGGADWILLPEEPVDFEAMCAHLKAVRARGKNYSIVVASEGSELPSSTEEESKLDAFGHVILGERNVGETVAKEIEKRTGFETRHAVMGHIQRGGSPSVFDRVLASRLGIRAAQCVYERDFGKMVALRGNEIVPVEIDKAVGVLRTVPHELYETVRTLFNK